MNFDITLEDNQGVPVGLRNSTIIPNGAVIYTSRRGEHNAVWLSRANAAQLWPILRHYAETGELCEVPPVAEGAPTVAGVIEQLETLMGKAETRAQYKQIRDAIQHLRIEYYDGCEFPDQTNAPLGIAELGNRVAMLIKAAQKLEFRILALEQDHLPGRMHRAGEPHAFGAVPVCVCGCSLDDHARDPQARAVVLGCEKCGTCEKFESAQVAYLVENAT